MKPLTFQLNETLIHINMSQKFQIHPRFLGICATKFITKIAKLSSTLLCILVASLHFQSSSADSNMVALDTLISPNISILVSWNITWVAISILVA